MNAIKESFDNLPMAVCIFDSLGLVRLMNRRMLWATAILLGSADSTSLECTLDVEGLGLFAKPQKKLEEYLETLRKVLGD